MARGRRESPKTMSSGLRETAQGITRSCSSIAGSCPTLDIFSVYGSLDTRRRHKSTESSISLYLSSAGSFFLSL